ncbi:MAG: hypothetical protein ACOX64_10160 [Candidatus Merdivicinus sp.]|jgi:hypothetical protein
MKCPFCGSEVTGNFCEDCGAPAPKPQSSGIPSSPAEASWDPPPPSDGAPWNPPPAVQDTESAFQQFSGGSSTSGYRPPSLVRKLLLAAVFVILLLAGLFLIFSISRSASRRPAGSRQSDGWYSEGSYRVGKDLEPGLYYLSADGGWLSADVDAPLFGGDDRYESFEIFGYLELEDGETLELDGGRMIEADSAPLPQTENGWYGPGMYRVGRDLPAEEYFFLSESAEEGISVFAFDSCGPDAEILSAISSETRCFYTPAGETYLQIRSGRFTAASSASAPEPADGWYPAGMYRIGSEIPLGEYYLQSNGDRTIFADILADSCDTGDSRLEGSSFENFGYFTVTEGTYLDVSGGRFTAVENAPIPHPEDGVYPAGMYRVGRDLPAGEYLLTPDQDYSAHYEILDSSQGGYEHQLDSGWSDGELSFRVEEGQYLNISFGTFRANP